MEQTEPRRLQCLETVPMEEREEEGGGRARRKEEEEKGAVSGASSASSVLKEMSQRDSMSQLLLKTRDLIQKIFLS